MDRNRRKLLKISAFSAGTLGLLAGGAYSLKRGIRFPTLGLEPHPLPTSFSLGSTTSKALSSDLIQLPDTGQFDGAFRAFSPVTGWQWFMHRMPFAHPDANVNDASARRIL